MANYTEAPTIDVASVLGDAASATPGLTDNLLLTAADSCGLLGTAQGLVDDAAAESAKAADAAINKTVESAGKLTKKVKDYASETASDAGAYLSDTFSNVNAKIQSLFDDADEDPQNPGEFFSVDLDNFLNSVQPFVDDISSAFTSAKDLISDAVSDASSFLNGDPDDNNDSGFIGDVVNIANDARTLACAGANQALTTVGAGAGGAFDSLAGPLSEGKSPQEVVKEKHSSNVKAKADTATDKAEITNQQAEALESTLDANVSSNLDGLNNLAVL